jgi:hypothetical protein
MLGPIPLLLTIATAVAVPAAGQEKPQPVVAIDLRPLGAAPDLFATLSDSKYEQRGIINLFWVGDGRVAVAFSTNRRWTNSDKPEPLDVRLVVFDGAGKQLNERNWHFGAELPAGEATLELMPGPENSILALHESVSEGPGALRIPEGNFVQVLNPDASLRQDFYIPSTSVYVPSASAEPDLVLQTFYADKHSDLVWWSGKPLKPHLKIEISKGREPVLAGANLAARPMCATPTLCPGVRVFRADAAPWTYKTPAMEYQPLPRLFLSPTALLIELRRPDHKQGQFVVAHQDGSETKLAPLPRDQQVAGVSSVSSDGQRFSVDTSQESGLCGALDLFCKERGNALVYDVAANKIIFQQEVSANGAVSAISPDGRQIAILDRDRVAIYALP